MMNKNLKFFFDRDGTPRARGPHSEQLLMSFLETDVQGSDHICHDIMDDLIAIEDGSATQREFEGNAHSVTLTPDGVTIETRAASPATTDPTHYQTGLKHFRQILEDWEAFILDDQDDLADEPVV